MSTSISEETIQKHRDDVATRARDANGRFAPGRITSSSPPVVSFSTPTSTPKDPTYESKTKTIKPPGITQKVESKGASNLLEQLVHVEENKTEHDESLIDVKVTNPLHRITQILQDIKNHQSTTVSLRFTIPLIALPIALFVFFQMGRAQAVCNTYQTTEAGMIKVLTFSKAKNTSHFYTPLLQAIPLFNQVPEIKEFEIIKRTVLLTTRGETFTIIHPGFSIDSLQSTEVLATGVVNTCHKTLTLDAEDNVIPK